MENIKEAFYAHIHNNRLITAGDRVLVSISAGKDSMALLHLLMSLQYTLGISIAVYHLDHRVRGQESFDDLLFVAGTAAQYGIPAFIEQYDFVRNKAQGKSFEQHAREYRYGRLSAIAREYGCTKIATAHTRDDQIETLLMRIFQGTGLAGLQGIALQRDNIIRPLLSLSTRDIYNYCERYQLPHRHDSTNDDVRYLRNYVRHRLIPAIYERFPHYDSALLNLQKLSLDAVASIDEFVMRLHPDFMTVHNGCTRVREHALSKSEYIFKHYCSAIISHQCNQYVDSDMLDALYRAHYSKRKNVTLFKRKGLYIYRRYYNNEPYVLFCSSPVDDAFTYGYTINVEHSVVIKELGITMQCSVVDSDGLPCADENTIHLHYTGCSTVMVRNRLSKDAIVRTQGSRTLKRLYIDYKLNPEQKQLTPVIVIDGKIAAVLLNVLVDKKPEIAPCFLPKKNQKVLVIRYWNYDSE